MTNEPWLVACLCAEWCGTCRDYRTVFERQAAASADGAKWAWVDVEDHADILGDVDIDNFPTVLIARGATVLFLGPVTPHPQTLDRLVQGALAGSLSPLQDAAAARLAARVLSLPEAS
jgi:thioredoxin-like negative regulator of GroEL